ncbi:MAG TPA: phosphoglycerate kinase [Candidatus Saccharimonadia bacterium]|nr:phosphoglycerate kinase [Candidatus Saccharimonadia bacterium]
MNKQTIRDIDVQNKTIFARLDWNVPVENGAVTDAFRIEATRSTLEYLWSKNCKIVIASHLGRPDGKPDPKFSLEPVAQKAAEVLGRPVKFVSDCVGPEAEAAVAALQLGGMLCLENVRFHREEEANDPAFAKQLAAFGDIFVYDAFASYRPHASTEGISHYLPAVAGLLVEREVDTITGAVEHPNRPLVAVIGGAKVSTKLEILTNLIPKVDAMLLTGPIANTFALVQGTNIGLSVAERDAEADVKKLLAIAESENTHLVLPADVMVSESLTEAKNLHQTPLAGVGAKEYIVDAAPNYGARLKSEIYDFLDFDGKSTVIWNGPLGITEVKEFRAGSRAMADAIIASKAVSIIGGGDTADFIDGEGLHDQFTWVSTGGGASLELMSGKGLACVDALLDKQLA